LGVVEGDKSLFERWMGDHFSKNLDAHNKTEQASRPSAYVPIWRTRAKCSFLHRIW
jgi:hypothetical protein